MASKKAGVLFITVGALLLLAAFALWCYNASEQQRAGEESALLLQEVRSAIRENDAADRQQENVSAGKQDGTENLSPEMPEISIDGYLYVGYLSIPELELELPVMSEWDYNRLKIAPCRQFGSSRTDDLVIAAHNYKTHFGSLSALSSGAEIVFTDMDGIENRYLLQRIETLQPDAVESVQNSGCDLVLYTCTPSGKARVAAFCSRAVQTNE